MNKITPVPGPSQADFDALNGNIVKKTFLPTERTTLTLPYSVPADGWYRFSIKGSTSGGGGFNINGYPSIYVDAGHNINAIICIRKGATIEFLGVGEAILQFMGLA